MAEIIFADENAKIAWTVADRIQQRILSLMFRGKYQPNSPPKYLLLVPEDRTVEQDYALSLIPGLVLNHYEPGSSVLLNETTMTLWEEFFST